MKNAILLFTFFLSAQAFGQLEKQLIPFRSGDKWGYAVSSDSLEIKAEYDFAAFFDNGVAAVRKRKKWGFIDTTGKTVLPITYREVRPFNKGLSIVVKDSLFGLINLKGEHIIPCQFDRLKYLGDGMYGVRGKRGWGLMNSRGDLLTPWYYDYIGKCHHGYIPVPSDGHWGLLDTTGAKATWFIYDMISVERSGNFSFRIGNTNHSMEPDMVDQLFRYHVFRPIQENGVFMFQRIFPDRGGSIGDGWGWARKDSLIIKAKYLEARDFSQYRAAVKQDEKWGYIDTTGEMKIANRWYEAYSFSYGLGLVLGKNGYGYVNAKGKKFIKPQYGQARSFVEGLAAVSTNKKGWGAWGYVDTLGNRISTFDFIAVSDFENGHAVVSRYNEQTGQKHYGILNTAGEEVIPVKHTGVWIEPGVGVIIANEDMLGLFDLKGKQILPYKYRSLVFTRTKHAIAFDKKGRAGVIDESGKKIVPFKYDDLIWDKKTELIRAKKEGKFGILNILGEEIIPVKCDSLRYYASELGFAAKKNGKWGFLLLSYGSENVFEFKEEYGAEEPYPIKEADLIVSYKYDRITPIPNSWLFEVWINGKRGYVNYEGEEFF